MAPRTQQHEHQQHQGQQERAAVAGCWACCCALRPCVCTCSAWPTCAAAYQTPPSRPPTRTWRQRRRRRALPRRWAGMWRAPYGRARRRCGGRRASRVVRRCWTSCTLRSSRCGRCGLVRSGAGHVVGEHWAQQRDHLLCYTHTGNLLPVLGKEHASGLASSCGANPPLFTVTPRKPHAPFTPSRCRPPLPCSPLPSQTT